MHIHQIRHGFATNSSSTHSILVFSGKRPTDYLVDGDFGWEFFTAASQDAKRLYLAAFLNQALEQLGRSEKEREAIVQVWAGARLSADPPHIDHQSVWALPCEFGGTAPSKEFFDALKEYVMRPDVAILGGNDNTDEHHPLGPGKRLLLPTDSYGRWVCRRDRGDVWVLFNQDMGTKIRFSFEDPYDMGAVEKSRTPELVDVKITDHCDQGCTYCYQDSTPKGEHANLFDLQSLLWILRQAKVFEVALGGGETTAHPHFAKIVDMCVESGITPNFTTRNLKWLDEEWAAEVNKQIGGWAFSVDSVEAIDQIAKRMKTSWCKRPSIQYVVGLHEDLTPFYKKCREHILLLTLLGYKSVGRGGDAPFPNVDWLGQYLELPADERPRISIDTVLASQSQQQLADADIPRWCYEVREGKHSCYVDAVKGTMARSSYEDAIPSRFKSVDDFERIYAGY